jgi:ABC-type multidrug transport system ATPase subunit
MQNYPDTQSKGVIKALDHLDLTVREGEILGILGPMARVKPRV